MAAALPDGAQSEAEAAAAQPDEGAQAPPFDPFARHRGFAKTVRSGNFSVPSLRFADAKKPPIDVRADKVLDLARFGKGPAPFIKTPRPKRADELPEGYEDRLKNDLERQFNLRNLMRYVMEIDEKDPIEWKKETSFKQKLDWRSQLRDLHRKPELVAALGSDHCRAELAWRHQMLDVMQWEQYFSKEIKDDFAGALWKHDPVKNPIRAKASDEANEESR